MSEIVNESTIDQVLEWISTLYASQVKVERDKANEYLQEFKKHGCAFDLSMRIIELNKTMESSLFCGQTIRHVIQKNIESVNIPEAIVKLFELMTKSELSSKCRRSLQIALADIIVKCPLEKNVFEYIEMKYMEMKDSQQQIQFILSSIELLTFIAQELSDKYLHLGQHRREEIRKFLKESSTHLLTLITLCINDERYSSFDHLLIISDCLISWIDEDLLHMKHFIDNDEVFWEILIKLFDALKNVGKELMENNGRILVAISTVFINLWKTYERQLEYPAFIKCLYYRTEDLLVIFKQLNEKLIKEIQEKQIEVEKTELSSSGDKRSFTFQLDDDDELLHVVRCYIRIFSAMSTNLLSLVIDDDAKKKMNESLESYDVNILQRMHIYQLPEIKLESIFNLIRLSEESKQRNLFRETLDFWFELLQYHHNSHEFQKLAKKDFAKYAIEIFSNLAIYVSFTPDDVDSEDELLYLRKQIANLILDIKSILGNDVLIDQVYDRLNVSIQSENIIENWYDVEVLLYFITGPLEHMPTNRPHEKTQNFLIYIVDNILWNYKLMNKHLYLAIFNILHSLVPWMCCGGIGCSTIIFEKILQLFNPKEDNAINEDICEFIDDFFIEMTSVLSKSNRMKLLFDKSPNGSSNVEERIKYLMNCINLFRTIILQPHFQQILASTQLLSVREKEIFSMLNISINEEHQSFLSQKSLNNLLQASLAATEIHPSIECQKESYKSLVHYSCTLIDNLIDKKFENEKLYKQRVNLLEFHVIKCGNVFKFLYDQRQSAKHLSSMEHAKQLGFVVYQDIASSTVDTMIRLLENDYRSEIMIEECSRTIRYIIRYVSCTSVEHLERLCKVIATLFEKKPSSTYIYLTSILVDEYTHFNPNQMVSDIRREAIFLIDMLHCFIGKLNDILNNEKSVHKNADYIDDFFRLITRITKNCPLELTKYKEHLYTIIDIAIYSLGIKSKEAAEHSAAFLSHFFNLSIFNDGTNDVNVVIKSFVQEISEMKHKLIISKILEISCRRPPGGVLKKFGEVIESLQSVYGKNMIPLIQEAVDNMPRNNPQYKWIVVLDEGKLREISQFLEYAMEKQDFQTLLFKIGEYYS
ncbi:hypothetical protein SNEBB_007711 [Seison nebaliae]|nr:hypothetical protein SNEBB_007711 [Seison nebaliae]